MSEYIKSIELEVGDTIVYFKKQILIKKIENKTNGDNELLINGKVRISKYDSVTKI